MKRKSLLFFILAILSLSSYSEKITSETDEVVIDLNNNTLVAEDGVAVTNGNIHGLFYNLERDPNTEIIKFKDNALINIVQESGNIKIETENGTVNRLQEKGEFYNNFAYINVAKSTGAEAPNDKIYIGSPYIKYENENIYMKDGWFTTDFSIINNPKEPIKAGYHLLSKDTLIEPDKQITFKDTNLFIGKRDVIPFDFPWFRVNIRQGSLVPLFPTLTSSDDYGAEVSVGVLYGNRKDKFKGGFAPKFADKTGWMIGRWENWYKTDNYGETRLNIDDLLLYSKVGDKPTDETQLEEYEKRNRKYRVTLTHDYDDKNGYFHFISTNSTKSMVGALEDVMEEFDNNNLYKTMNISRQRYDQNIGYYGLKADLKNLGENKDITFKGDVSLVSDKKAQSLIVYDKITDEGTSYNIDHDLYTNLELEKNNDQYKFKVKYDYLYDLDPGSTKKDLQSRNEAVGAEFLHKNSGVGVAYSKRVGDQYRPLEFWEEDIKTTLRQDNVLGISFNYVPKTVSKYEIDNHETVKFSLGDYSLGSYHFKPSVSYNTTERKLDLVRDSYRTSKLGSNRFAEYNRFENIIYTKNEEKRIDLDLSNENEKYRFGMGETTSEVWDRNGNYIGGYDEYRNLSNFYELELGRRNIEMGALGTSGISFTVRQDDFKNSNDKTNAFNLKLGNDITFTETDNTKVTNNLNIEFQKYNFSGNENNRKQRLITKSDFIKVDDKIKFEIGEKEITYDVSYKEAKDPYGEKDKNNKIFTNKVNVELNEDTDVTVFYDENKRFTNETTTRENENDLNTRRYGSTINFQKHSVSFSNLKLEYHVEDAASSPYDVKENINENRVSYSYKTDKDKITLSYAEGKDRLTTSTNREINRKNREYAALYNTYGDVEQDFYGSYTQYRYGNSSLTDNIRNTDVYRFSYAYRDKRFEEEELLKYATLEYEKPEDEITVEDIAKIKSVMDRRQGFSDQFELTRIADETFRIGNYKKNFRVYLTFEKNNARYSQTGNLRDSLSKFEGGLTYMHNRLGLGYKFKELADWRNSSGVYNWEKASREHELALFAKIGKPSEGWRIKTYVRAYENLRDTNSDKKALDGIGIEIGKEMGYYEWAVSYENKYRASTRDYEWRAGIHFTLLTFPNNSVFGFGANTKSKSTRPTGYLFDKPNTLNDEDDFKNLNPARRNRN